MMFRKAKASYAAHHEVLVRALYDTHGKALLAYAKRLTNDQLTAEQITQETLVRAWRQTELAALHSRSLRGRLLTMARNIIAERHSAEDTSPLQTPHASRRAVPSVSR
ncbi:sigma factor [Streptomyces sp. NPDC007851]|uniref:sigma factor n=1 Tax=Streptomyces sp. NPDC007851 TaxID=3155008 RepID=UPI0033C0D746